ncbi:MAG: hypothetical protein PHT53_03495 [Candidatus Omnitrophica bacterium]|nr:hypothetical protein [Candidatus Omnitrophota bacterium]
MKKKILIFAFIFLLIPVLRASEIEKISEIMPFGAQLLSQEESPANKISSGVAYKYSYSTTKENVLEFYQDFLLKEGYVSVRKQTNDKASTSVFKKENQSVAITVPAKSENGLNIYYVILSKPNLDYKQSERHERLIKGSK